MDLLSTGFAAKYAPVIFLTMTKDGIKFDSTELMRMIIHSFIIAGVTMYGTVRSMEKEFDYLKRDMAKITILAEGAVKTQAEIIPVRELQIKELQHKDKELEERIARLESMSL